MRKFSVAVLVVAAFALGVFFGRLSITSLLLGSSASQPGIVVEETQSAQKVAETRTLTTANLSDGQRRLLTTLGIDANTITVTPQMVACAEAKLGAARIDEIANGATPTFSEGLSLLACYR